MNIVSNVHFANYHCVAQMFCVAFLGVVASMFALPFIRWWFTLASFGEKNVTSAWCRFGNLCGVSRPLCKAVADQGGWQIWLNDIIAAKRRHKCIKISTRRLGRWWGFNLSSIICHTFYVFMPRHYFNWSDKSGTKVCPSLDTLSDGIMLTIENEKTSS